MFGSNFCPTNMIYYENKISCFSPDGSGILFTASLAVKRYSVQQDRGCGGIQISASNVCRMRRGKDVC